MIRNRLHRWKRSLPWRRLIPHCSELPRHRQRPITSRRLSRLKRLVSESDLPQPRTRRRTHLRAAVWYCVHVRGYCVEPVQLHVIYLERSIVLPARLYLPIVRDRVRLLELDGLGWGNHRKLVLVVVVNLVKRDRQRVNWPFHSSKLSRCSPLAWRRLVDFNLAEIEVRVLVVERADGRVPVVVSFYDLLALGRDGVAELNRVQAVWVTRHDGTLWQFTINGICYVKMDVY